MFPIYQARKIGRIEYRFIKPERSQKETTKKEGKQALCYVRPDEDELAVLSLGRSHDVVEVVGGEAAGQIREQHNRLPAELLLTQLRVQQVQTHDQRVEDWKKSIYYCIALCMYV